MTRLIVGLGTGRSGTHSLAALLGRQPNTEARHQPPPCLPWHVDYGWYGLTREMVAGIDSPVVALVGWYYLPYVDLLLRDFDARFVCLRRDREETVCSIDRLTAEFDHWSNRSPSDSANTRWRNLFPSYDVDDKRVAIGLYWDEYHRRAEAQAAQHPDRVRVLPTTDLNEEAGVRRVLDAAGYGAEAVIEAGIREGLMTDYRWRDS